MLSLVYNGMPKPVTSLALLLFFRCLNSLSLVGTFNYTILTALSF